jgi:hypothetical protein
MVADLQSENARLQTEITTLLEQKLAAERHACLDRPAQTSAGRAKDEAPDVPVVRMAPVDEDAESTSGEGEQKLSIRPAEPVEAEEEPMTTPPGTRPVLKVRGQHEAWVYHRPLDETEKAGADGGDAPTAE